jgi:hypothetical protein
LQIPPQQFSKAKVAKSAHVMAHAVFKLSNLVVRPSDVMLVLRRIVHHG